MSGRGKGGKLGSPCKEEDINAAGASANYDLHFPVDLIGIQLRQGQYATNIVDEVPAYLAAVMDRICANILELAGNAAAVDKKKKSRIKTRHIAFAIENDEEPIIKLLGSNIAAFNVLPNSETEPDEGLRSLAETSYKVADSTETPSGQTFDDPKKKDKGKKNTQSTGKKNKKKTDDSYSPYVHKVLEQVHPEIGISKNGMLVMNSFMNDMFDRIAKEAGKQDPPNLGIGISEIERAVNIILSRDLASQANLEGRKAANRYICNADDRRHIRTQKDEEQDGAGSFLRRLASVAQQVTASGVEIVSANWQHAVAGAAVFLIRPDSAVNQALASGAGNATQILPLGQ